MAQKSLDTYRKAEEAVAKKNTARYEAQQKAQAQKSYAAQAAAIEAAAEKTVQEYRDKAAQKEAGYRTQYDTNAVAEKITQRRVAETMADLGLARSGSSRSRLAAAETARKKADSAVREQQKSTLAALTKLIYETQQKAQAQKKETLAKVEKQRQTAVASYRLREQSQAESRAKASYAAYLKEQTAKGKTTQSERDKKRASFAQVLMQERHMSEEKAWQEAYRVFPKNLPSKKTK